MINYQHLQSLNDGTKTGAKQFSILCAEFDGISHEDIAQETGLTLHLVKMFSKSGHASLKAKLRAAMTGADGAKAKATIHDRTSQIHLHPR